MPRIYRQRRPRDSIIWRFGPQNSELFSKRNRPSELKDLFTDSGLSPLSINSIEHITFRDAHAYEAIKQECEELSRIAAAIGCPCIVVVPGPLPPGGADRETIVGESVKVLNELCDISARHEVALAFEFLGQTECSVPTLDLAAEIVREADREDLGLVDRQFSLLRRQLDVRDDRELSIRN